MATLGEFDAVLEIAGWDEAFLAARTSAPGALARQIAGRVRAVTQLDCGIGIGQNKLQSKLATGFGKPAGIFRLTRQSWLDVLGCRPTDALWGIGSRTAARLARLGISTVGELAAPDRPARPSAGRADGGPGGSAREAGGSAQGRGLRQVGDVGPALAPRGYLPGPPVVDQVILDPALDVVEDPDGLVVSVCGAGERLQRLDDTLQGRIAEDGRRSPGHLAAGDHAVPDGAQPPRSRHRAAAPGAPRSRLPGSARSAPSRRRARTGAACPRRW